MDNIRRERFDLQVDTEETTYNVKFELDKNVKIIKGILITSEFEEMIYYRGSQRIEINGKEYFPEGYETKLLMSGLHVSPNDKYYNVGEIKAGDGIIKFTYKDSPGRFNFTAYRVTLYLLCEI